jgi:CBS domain-containing protein
MNAADVMTRQVITVTPDTPVPAIIQLILTHGISGLPVLDGEKLVGVVTEGDLVRRAELGTEHKRGAWRAFITGTATLARDYVRSHGTSARDLMNDPVVVQPETPLAEIADLMEEKHIRRVPVVQDGRVVGIVSRRNLLRALASLEKPDAERGAEASDSALRDAILKELSRQNWSRRPENSVVVTEGVVHLWGLAGTEEEKRALELLVEKVPGVLAVRNHVVVLEAEPYPLLLGS